MSDAVVRIVGDESPLNQAFSRAESAANRFASGSLRNIGSSIGAAFTTGAIIKLASDAVELGGKFDDLSKRTGVGTEALQKLDFAARQNGASIDDIVGSLQKLSVAMSEALGGNADKLQAFSRLGITLDDLKSKSADEIFIKLSDAVKNSTDPTSTMSELVDVLGKNAGALIPLLVEGSDGIRALGDEAQKTGNVISDSMISKLDELGDRLQKNKGFLRQAGAEIAVFAGDVATKAVQGIKAGASTIALIPELIKSSGSDKGKLLDFIAGEAGFDPQETIRAGTRQNSKKAASFNREVREPGSNEKAKRIESLAQQVEAQAEEQARSRLKVEDQINELIAKRDDLLSQGSQVSDGEEYLKIQKQILDVEKDITSLNKERDRENADLAKKAAQKVNDFLGFQDQIDQAKNGHVSVSAPITDNLARIGGFVGGAGDSQMRLIERQMKVQEDIKKILDDIRKKLDPYGHGEGDDIISSLNI